MIRLLAICYVLTGCTFMEVHIYEPCRVADEWCRQEPLPDYRHKVMPDLGKGGLKIKDYAMSNTQFVSEKEYLKALDEFDIHVAESGIDREYRTDSEMEELRSAWLDKEFGDNWSLIAGD